jgi:hypothetical protein
MSLEKFSSRRSEQMQLMSRQGFECLERLTHVFFQRKMMLDRSSDRRNCLQSQVLKTVIIYLQ